MPTGKGPYFAEQFKDYVSFHYITQEMDLLYTKTLYNVPWWPTTHQLPAGVTPSIPVRVAMRVSLSHSLARTGPT